MHTHAAQIQSLEDAADGARTRPPCVHAHKPSNDFGSGNLLVRDGAPSFRDYNQAVKQLAGLSKEYRQVNKKLEDVLAEKKQLRAELAAKNKESAGLHRQLQAANKVLAETKAAYQVPPTPRTLCMHACMYVCMYGQQGAG